MDMEIKISLEHLVSTFENLWRIVPGRVKSYYMMKAWQRSCRNHAVKSRVRHAKRKAARGYRYKGGK